MNTKLTLTIEQQVIEKAKAYAKEKERSLSDLIENFLKTLVKEGEKTEQKTTPIVKSLKGSFQAPENFDYKVELNKALKKKHLK